MDQEVLKHSGLTIGLLQKELESARLTIALLRDLASILYRDLDEARVRRDGDAMTEEAHLLEITRLREALAEQTMRREALEAELAQEKESAEPLTVRRRTADHLQYYYRDFLAINRKYLDREDAERLYEVLKFLFNDLKKEGIVSKEK